MALHSRQPMRASILVENHCTVFTINASFHVMRTGNPGNLRYCHFIKPTVIGTRLKNCLFASRYKYFFETRFVSRNIGNQKQSYPEETHIWKLLQVLEDRTKCSGWP